MTTKHFDAIIAKNNIARELKSSEPNLGYIFWCLREIEDYTGEGNQPSVSDIIDTKEFAL